MRLALLGNHPDGVDLADALAASGRHALVACSGVPAEVAGRWAGVRRVSDVEEVLADPAVEAVIVAGAPSVRPAQLRRALQAERHVLCVHPADGTPDIAYEAALLARDTGRLLVPILPEGLHPSVRRLAEFVDRAPGKSPVGAFQALLVERASPGEVLENTGVAGLPPAIPGWDVLRRLGGEVAEVSALAAGEEPAAGEPLLLAGRFERGGLFQVTLLPQQRAPFWRLVVLGSAGRAELLFPQGWDGPSVLEWRDPSGQTCEEYRERWDPWPAVVEAFEAAQQPLSSFSGERSSRGFSSGAACDWQDEVRALELDDAARRSVARRRANVMEYQEASEEVGFKGTMALAGCGMLWAVLLLLIVSRWVPALGWVILPLLLVFIGLQALRYILPRKG
jgi:predicted dehydrogenase